MASFYDDDRLKLYLQELSMIQPLSKEEESELLQRARAQDVHAESAKKRLIEATLHLVVPIAERHFSGRVSILELIHDGNLGLFFAIDTFTGSKESFAAYAVTCIEDAISKANR